MSTTKTHSVRSATSPRVTEPCSIESEDAIIALLLTEGAAAWEAVADGVSAQDFFQESHGQIYSAVGYLQTRHEPVDPVTVASTLDPSVLAGLGGISTLSQLALGATGSAGLGGLPAYAQTVRDRSLKRRLMRAARAIEEACAKASPEQDIAQLVTLAGEKITEAAEGAAERRGFMPLKPFLSEVVDEIDRRFHAGSDIVGLKTPFAALNEMTAGLQSDDLVIVAARPSMGKTAFALSLTECAMTQGVSVGFFSLEMSGRQLAMRLLASGSRVAAHRLRIGRLEDDDWARLMPAVAHLMQEETLFIDETPLLSVGDMAVRARRLQREQIQKNQPPMGLVIVDYLQLLQTQSGARRFPENNRAAELSTITRALKGLARDLRVPVIALSQLNRALEQRQSKRPILSDLRESGSIEQDADTILFLYRDEVYHPDTEDKGVAEVIIGKQRNGPTGVARVGFQGEHTRFTDLVPDYACGPYGTDTQEARGHSSPHNDVF